MLHDEQYLSIHKNYTTTDVLFEIKEITSIILILSTSIEFVVLHHMPDLELVINYIFISFLIQKNLTYFLSYLFFIFICKVQNIR